MNMMDRGKLQEDSPERELVIYNLAKKKGQSNPDLLPITIELVDQSCTNKVIGGFDVYSMRVKEINDNGRIREQNDLEIRDTFVTFVKHEAYEGLMKVIPATEKNLNVLATHASGNWFYIHEDKYREIVEEKAAKLVPVRDEKKDMSQIEYMPHVESDVGKKLTALEQREKELAEREAAVREKEENLQKLAVEKEPEPEPEQDAEDEDGFEAEQYEPELVKDKESVPLGDIEAKAKEAVYEKHAKEIEEMKSRGIKRLDMTKEFRGWLQEELNAVEA